MIVILQGIRSLHNVGSIFRTADAAGIKKLYLCGITPAPVDRFGAVRPQLAKVALGAERSVAWEKARSASKLIDDLKHRGFDVFAIEQDRKAIPYYKLPPIRHKPSAISHTPYAKTALLVGAEVTGLPKSLLRKCDRILEIPMHGTKESLNVAVAFGIVVFGLRHNRI